MSLVSSVSAAGRDVHMLLRAIRGRLPPNRRRVRGRRNVVRTTGAVCRRLSIDIAGDDNLLVIEANARAFDVSIRIRGDGHQLVIGPHVTLWKAFLHLEDDAGTLTLGEATTIYDAQFGVMEGGSITVGRDCLFASGIQVRNGDSHALVESTTGRRLNPAADVRIGDHVWIGERALILKGSRIGDNAVVGAGSIVTGDLPSSSASAGAPARVLREGVTWTRTRS